MKNEQIEEKKTVKGFDVSALMGGKDLLVWMDYSDQVRVQIRHVTRERFGDLVNTATIVGFDRRHQKTEQLDSIKFGELLGEEAIADWDGMQVDSEPLPCNKENRKILMRKWVDFAKWVSDVCTDLERLVTAEKEAARKNSQSTSALGLTTPE